jgi:tRNA (adenine37-N6)-methyltransferase
MDSSEQQGLALFSLTYLSWEFVRHWIKSRHFEDAYWGERRGRTRVEQEMRRLAEVQLNTSEGFFIQPIGTIDSCYRQCVGTPRQGMLVPSSRATLYLANNMSPEALDGLEDFSHVWLFFKFHMNTNTLKEAKAFSGIKENNRKYTFTAKVTPPMLKEKKG